MSYGTWLSDGASASLLALGDRAYLEVTDTLTLLESHPELGREYDPLYEASKPPFPVRVFFIGNYGIYYTPDHYETFERLY